MCLRVREDGNCNNVWAEGEEYGLPQRIPRLKSWNPREKLGAVVVRGKKWESRRGEKESGWKEGENLGISFA